MLDSFALIGNIFLLLNVILYFFNIKKYSIGYKIFAIYLAYILLVQIISYFFAEYYHNNLFLSHFYFVGQFVFLSFFYLTIMKNDAQKKKIQVGLVGGLVLLGVQYIYDSNVFFRFNLFEIFVTSFLLLTFGILHLYNLLGESKEFYYINLGVLIYLLGSTILFLVGNVTSVLSDEFNEIPWVLNAILYIVYQIFILVEWKKSFSKKALRIYNGSKSNV